MTAIPNEVIAYYQKTLNKLAKDPAFAHFLIYHNGSFIDDITTHTKIRADFKIRSGASRMAIVPNKQEWVLKIDYDQDLEYTKKEIEVYEKAVAEGTSEFFAEAVYAGFHEVEVEVYEEKAFSEAETATGFAPIPCIIKALKRDQATKTSYRVSIPLFFFRKAATKGIYHPAWEDHERREMENVLTARYGSYNKSPLTCSQAIVGFHFLHEYGIDRYVALCKFIKKHKLNDFHSGNIGWIDKKIVIIDYCGYGSSSESWPSGE